MWHCDCQGCFLYLYLFIFLNKCSSFVNLKCPREQMIPLSSCKRKTILLQMWGITGCWVSFRCFELSCECSGTYVLKRIKRRLWNSLRTFSKADLTLAGGFQCGFSLYSQKHSYSFHWSLFPISTSPCKEMWNPCRCIVVWAQPRLCKWPLLVGCVQTCIWWVE